MFSGLGLAPLVLIFAASAGAIWVAGIYLSRSTDTLDVRLGIGEALGGAILLAIATNLPEIQIRFLVLLPFLGVGLVLSTWGMRVSKQRALDAGRALVKGGKS